jgi:hypothetical protein
LRKIGRENSRGEFFGKIWKENILGNILREKFGENCLAKNWREILRGKILGENLEGNVHSTSYRIFIGRVGICTILCL